MPFITADYIHDGHHFLPTGTTVEISDSGTIIAIHDAPQNGAIHYEGIIAPGFINAHCHLELSHMKGVIPEHTGLIPFLQTIPRHRNDFTDEQKHTARHAALGELLQNGVVAVGDIANTTDTLDLRTQDKLHIHTFIEAIGFTEANAQQSFGWSEQTFAAYAAQTAGNHILRQSIVPHAPYSVSASLFRLINAHANGSVVSIHNQESLDENAFFVNKTGGVCGLLSSLGIDYSLFQPTGKTSLLSYLNWMPVKHPTLFVHNTRTTEEDIQIANLRQPDNYWCLCPNANLYIENTLPNIGMLYRSGAAICIGTDSLASNHQLSILAEMHAIHRHFPEIEWGTLLSWATSGGAKALQMSDVTGSFTPGSTPGILQLAGSPADIDAKKIIRIW